MKTFRLASALGVVAAVLTLGTATALAASAKIVPFSATYSGTAVVKVTDQVADIAATGTGRATSLVTIERCDEGAIGQLFHFFEVQTLVAGALLGIDPLDQPGVEAGKRLTFAMAGRRGYEADAERVSSMLSRKREDLVLG